MAGIGEMSWGTAVRRAIRNPGVAWHVGMALARGLYYPLKFRLLGRRVTVGRRFRVEGRLDIRGPGTVIFGDDCVVRGTRFAPATPYTHDRDAVIRFGNRVMLSSTRLGCKLRIEVGDGADLADARIMDTDFHAVNARGISRRNTGGAAKPVRIGAHAWIGAGAMVLKGVSVGDNSIVGAGAVVMRNVPPDAVVVGNPARVVWRLAPGPEGD